MLTYANLTYFLKDKYYLCIDRNSFMKCNVMLTLTNYVLSIKMMYWPVFCRFIYSPMSKKNCIDYTQPLWNISWRMIFTFVLQFILQQCLKFSKNIQFSCSLPLFVEKSWGIIVLFVLLGKHELIFAWPHSTKQLKKWILNLNRWISLGEKQVHYFSGNFC